MPRRERPVYCADSSCLIYFFRYYRQGSVLDPMWEMLRDLIDEGRFFICREGKREIERQNDAIRNWVIENPAIVEEVTQRQIEILRELTNCHQRPQDFHKDGPWADLPLIALAVDKSELATLDETVTCCRIVTEEKRGSPIKIPDIAARYGVDSITTLDMCSIEGLRMTRG